MINAQSLVYSNDKNGIKMFVYGKTENKRLSRHDTKCSHILSCLKDLGRFSLPSATHMAMAKTPQSVYPSCFGHSPISTQLVPNRAVTNSIVSASTHEYSETYTRTLDSQHPMFEMRIQ